MVTRLKKTVVLVGMMGAGKTAVGTQLARQLGVPFLDTDHEIEAAAHRTIPEIFARDGEAFFRARETQVLDRLLQGPPSVLSTGGGAFLAEANRDLIDAYGVSVWLSADLETLWQRVRNRNTRPLLRTPNPRRTLADLLTAREGIYARARVTVPSERGTSVERTAQRVQDALAAHPDVLED
ncbi:shikimate kinase [Falsirhodobacter sp. 20TX0035]|uniref:shikimate kinase n=1 Tax=Falsirhodobacter sp. 20TX0035 TaxID=3022019 RepID=UPI002331179F|nr:shikimate kinase [Falsirhodobacter sp. 20TX0035]MDB6453345.1 shikimate kinase [Falsirhodobacter sp. 20TX0035]